MIQAERVAEKFQKNMASKDAELADAMKRYVVGSMQQYRTRYLLAKLTQFVEMAFKGMNSSVALGEYAALEIEHVLPDKPENELRESLAAANPGKGYDEYKVRLGNLTMLEQPINVVAGNGFFEERSNNSASMFCTSRIWTFRSAMASQKVELCRADINASALVGSRIQSGSSPGANTPDYGKSRVCPPASTGGFSVYFPYVWEMGAGSISNRLI